MLWYLKIIRKKLPHFYLAFLVLFLLGADGKTNESFTTTAYFSWWYVLGGYAAVVYRNVTVGVHHHIRGTFKWWILLVPMVINSLFSAPLVLGIITILGRPSDLWFKNMFIAFTAVYMVMDVTWFGYKTTKAVDRYIKKKVEKKNKQKK